MNHNGVARHATLEVYDQGPSINGNVALLLVLVFGNGIAHAHSNSVSGTYFGRII